MVGREGLASGYSSAKVAPATPDAAFFGVLPLAGGVQGRRQAVLTIVIAGGSGLARSSYACLASGT
ncbi:MAG: hypothetical protein AW07_01680 [Candidatus Accumulibacter sp. SK-11]|nr:MAG: hypothetical protein AW07_01680 [Candidatus Accumulibacter sp. SK-11]